MRRSLAFAATLLLTGCGQSDLPQGPDFARLEAPMTHYGLESFRLGDPVGLQRAEDELRRIAEDETRPGDDKCTRESVIAREADRIATLLGRLARVRLLNATEEERFVFFEGFVNAPDYRNTIVCGVEQIERFAEILPVAIGEGSHDAMTSYYWVWREDLNAGLGGDAQARLTTAANRLVARGLPRSKYR